MAEYTRAAAVKNAIYEIGKLVLPAEVHVAFGHPGQAQIEDVFTPTDTTSEQVPGPMSASARQRKETIVQTVIVRSFRAGGPEQEQIASDRAYYLLGLVENHIRKNDPTLGGLVEWCFLTSTSAAGALDPQLLAQGRLIMLGAEFTAEARIRSV